MHAIWTLRLKDSDQFPWQLWVYPAIRPAGPDTWPGRSELWCNPEAGCSSHGQSATLVPLQCSHFRSFPDSCTTELCLILQQWDREVTFYYNRGCSPTPKIILIGSRYLHVQFAILVWVIISSTGVNPLQQTEAGAVELLACRWVVGVDMHILPLQSWAQTKLKLIA